MQYVKKLPTMDKGYDLPIDSCIVLHFYPDSICIRLQLDDETRGLFTQMIKPFQNTMVVREDKGFFYPQPIYINIIYHLLKFTSKNTFYKNPRYFDNIKLTYLNSFKFQFEEFLQIDLKEQKHFEKVERGCHLSLISPEVIVPLRFKVFAIMSPGEQKVEYSHVFRHDNKLGWGKDSFSWILSTVYHINCSNNLQWLPHTYYKEVYQLCKNTYKIILLDNSCHVCLQLPVSSIQKHSGYHLSLHMPGIKQTNHSEIGILHVVTFPWMLCGKNKYRLIDEFSLFGSYQKLVPIDCAKYTIRTKLNKKYFDKNDVYENQFFVSQKRHISLDFKREYFYISKANMRNITGKYFWRNTFQKPTRQLGMKIFSSKNYLSWVKAWSACKSKGMKLMTVSSKSQLLYIAQKIYEFNHISPYGIFVAISKKVI